MMKTYLGLICAIALLLMPTIGLAQNTATVGVTADVDEQLELTIWIKQVQDEQDPGTEGTEVTSMSFGALTDTFADGSPAGNLFCRTWFAVFMIPSTSGRAYIVRQTSNRLTSGANSIPDNCFMMSPDYQRLDEWQWTGGSAAQGPMPGGASLGSPGSAVGSNKTIYTSEAAGSSRIIRCYYSITNGYQADGTPRPGFSGEGIPLDQSAGHYTASVTFSVVLQ